ncbi:MAG: hypothetical protein IJU40_03495, partial [Desulfovibrionaceae bacterium]|nr:hypothetical protein [Desulfovibrionaceae bacterium]
KEGILSGCNVIMPNLTFKEARSNYQLYDHKPVELEFSQTLNFAAKELETLGYELKSARGDFSA